MRDIGRYRKIRAGKPRFVDGFIYVCRRNADLRRRAVFDRQREFDIVCQVLGFLGHERGHGFNVK